MRPRVHAEGRAPGLARPHWPRARTRHRPREARAPADVRSRRHMTRRDISPPRGGTPPPAVSRDVRGREIELRPLAVEICRRYRKEFPDEEERYGEAGNAWCVHDNLHILNWAFLETAHGSVLDHQVRWLG